MISCKRSYNHSQTYAITHPTERNQDSLEKWLIPGLEQEIEKMILKYLVLPELKKKKTIKDSELDENNTGNKIKGLPLAKDGIT